MSSDIIVALIGGASAVLVGILGMIKIYYDRKLAEVAHEEDACPLVTFEDFLTEWADVNVALTNLFATTNIDRFVMLRAQNGLEDPKWTTAFFQMRMGDQEPFNYVHFELDDDYVTRLNDVKSKGFINFMTKDLPPCAIRDVYLMEKLKASAWFMLKKQLLDTEGRAAITYCSFSSHVDAKISQYDLMRCKLVADRIKGVLDT